MSKLDALVIAARRRLHEQPRRRLLLRRYLGGEGLGTHEQLALALLEVLALGFPVYYLVGALRIEDGPGGPCVVIRDGGCRAIAIQFGDSILCLADEAEVSIPYEDPEAFDALEGFLRDAGWPATLV
jgi:hypothetical protein